MSSRFTARRRPRTASRRSPSASNTTICSSSNKREDILAARDLIVAEPKLVTPMTMMVLAIRLYDVGLRDDAVFWFYVAKDRYIVMSEVLDVKTQALAQADDAVRNFSTLAGPFINGYAFCDLAKQKELHAKAVDWVETNPYEVMFMARAPALPGDRAENAKRAVANAKERAAKERAYFDDAKTREALLRHPQAQRGRRQVLLEVASLNARTEDSQCCLVPASKVGCPVLDRRQRSSVPAAPGSSRR